MRSGLLLDLIAVAHITNQVVIGHGAVVLALHYHTNLLRYRKTIFNFGRGPRIHKCSLRASNFGMLKSSGMVVYLVVAESQSREAEFRALGLSQEAGRSATTPSLAVSAQLVTPLYPISCVVTRASNHVTSWSNRPAIRRGSVA